MVIGFYGSSYGLSEIQFETIINKIKELDVNEFRHTDTIGSVDIHEYIIMNKLSDKIVLYPPSDMSIRSFSAVTNIVEIKQENNLSQSIKSLCENLDLLIIANNEKDTVNSGTYACYDIGKKLNTKIMIITENGSLLHWPNIKNKGIKNGTNSGSKEIN